MCLDDNKHSLSLPLLAPLAPNSICRTPSLRIVDNVVVSENRPILSYLNYKDCDQCDSQQNRSPT